MEYRIRFIKGVLTGQVFPLGSNSKVIGRYRSNDIVVPAVDVSRRHARLTVSGAGVTIENMSSRHTCVDGVVMTMGQIAQLAAGQNVTLGKFTEFVLEAYADNAAGDGTAMAEGTSLLGQTQAEFLSNGDERAVQTSTSTASASRIVTSMASTAGGEMHMGAQTTLETSGRATQPGRRAAAIPPPPRIVHKAPEKTTSGQTLEKKTILATPEVIAEMRRDEERQLRMRRAAILFMGLLFVMLMGVFYYFFLYRVPEETLGWPMKGNKALISKTVPLQISNVPKGIYIRYPDVPGLVMTPSDGVPADGRLEIASAIGRDGDVPFHLTVEYRRDSRLLHEGRGDSLERWMQSKRDAANPWSFDNVGPTNFWANYNGIPYNNASFTREREDGASMYGIVSYFRCEDTEIALIREIPSLRRYEGTQFLNTWLLAFTQTFILQHWEGQAGLGDKPIDEALAEATKLLENEKPDVWTRIQYLLCSSLCLLDKDKDAKNYEKAMELLQELRKRQHIWYNSQLLAYRKALNFKDEDEQKRIKETCTGIFSSPEDRRYFMIRRNDWK